MPPRTTTCSWTRRCLFKQTHFLAHPHPHAPRGTRHPSTVYLSTRGWGGGSGGWSDGLAATGQGERTRRVCGEESGEWVSRADCSCSWRSWLLALGMP
eukprot:scaffold32502_cov26-Tisochrysis_lutea.AAC.2